MNKEDELKTINSTVRPSFEYNVSFVDKYLVGKGIDMGCGSCPLLKPNCIHIDISSQPLAELQINTFIQQDAINYVVKEEVDFIFSSHMIEDLPTNVDIINCLNKWAEYLYMGGYLVILLPDIEGGRYPDIDEGNPSHRIRVGKKFIQSILPFLTKLELIQIDTIPHEKSCTIDVVFKRI